MGGLGFSAIDLNELDLVYCRVYFSMWGNGDLFNKQELEENLTNEAISYLGRLGVSCKAEMPSQMGGGGFDGLFEGLRFAWEHRDFIAIGSALISLVKSYARILLSKKIDISKPRMDVVLRLKIKDQFNNSQKNSINKLLIGRLINLKNLNDALCKVLTEKYPIIIFDQSLKLSIYSRSFRISYSIPKENQTLFNEFRLIRLFKSLKIKENRDCSYNFTKWLSISRLDRKTKYENEFWVTDSKSKKYYLFLSLNILGD